MIEPCFAKTDRFLDVRYVIVSVFYSFLGVAFFIVGVSMNLSLKKYFKHFYTMFRCFLWIACLCLTLPLFVRSAINFLQAVWPEFKAWYLDYDNFTVNTTLYLVLSTYIPIMTQISSLIFGYLRKKQEQKLLASGEHVANA